MDRLRQACDPSQQVTSDADWIRLNTSIKSKPFSFQHHEYQLPILNDPHRIKYCRKCSQLGITEAAIRRTLAKCLRFPGVNAMYALPTAKLAIKIGSTRFPTAIEASPAAKEALYKTDSSEIRRFSNESFIYMQGCSSSSQVISIPVDFLVVDEKDIAENPKLVSSLTSRLTHSPHKDQFHFSTPTVSGYGISADYDSSLQHVEIQKCNHCNHYFVPDYYENVALPGFNRPIKGHSHKGAGVKTLASALANQVGVSPALAEVFVNASSSPIFSTLETSPLDRSLKDINHLTRTLLRAFPPDTAYLECPKCRRKVDQSIQYREWIRVNESEFSSPNSIDTPVGYQITPFSAPAYIDSDGLPNGVPPSRMLQMSTEYVDVMDFVNYGLGLPFDDASTGLSEQEIRDLFGDAPAELRGGISNQSDVPLYPDHNPPYQISGMDLGGTCARLTAYPAPNGHIRIMSAEQIPLHSLKSRYQIATAQHRVISSVVDAMPYTDTVAALQQQDPRLFACMFSSHNTTSNALELFQVKEKETDETKATFGLRQITTKKDTLMDFVVANIREKKISFAPTISNMQLKETIIKHLRDPKRIKLTQSTSQNPKGRYTWQKSSSGEDHFFLALAYLLLANAIKGLHGSIAPLPLLLSKVKLTNTSL